MMKIENRCRLQGSFVTCLQTVDGQAQLKPLRFRFLLTIVFSCWNVAAKIMFKLARQEILSPFATTYHLDNAVGGSVMEGIGSRLRAIRQKWGLTLREVEERSVRIAQHRDNPSYRISASWLDRIEREDRVLSSAKLIVLGAIYSLSSEELLSLHQQEAANSIPYDQISEPNTTLLLTGGLLESHARLWLPDRAAAEPIPEATTLLPREIHLPSHYRRGIIGRQDKTLEPMVRAGTFVLINTQRRAIAHRREWTNEFDRPIYFLYTRAGYFCGWCELDQGGDWLTLVPHYASYVPNRRWKYRLEIEVIGRIAAMLQRFENPSAGQRRHESY